MSDVSTPQIPHGPPCFNCKFPLPITGEEIYAVTQEVKLLCPRCGYDNSIVEEE